MKKSVIAALVLACLPMAHPVLAEDGSIVVEGAWSRASIGMNRPGVAYMTLRNAGDTPMVITDLRTDLAMMPMIHSSTTDAQGVTRMAHVEDVEIAAGETVALDPGGLHVMLMDLQRPMLEGDNFILSLILANGSEVSVEVPILGIAARGPAD